MLMCPPYVVKGNEKKLKRALSNTAKFSAMTVLKIPSTFISLHFLTLNFYQRLQYFLG